MTENFPKLMTDVKTKIQEAQKIQKQKKKTKNTKHQNN